MMNKWKFKKLGILIGALIWALSACVFSSADPESSSSGNKEEPQQSVEKSEQVSGTDNPTHLSGNESIEPSVPEASSEEAPPSESENENQIQNPEQSKTDPEDKVVSEKPNMSKPKDNDSDSNKHTVAPSDGLVEEWKKLAAVAEAGQSYYSEYFSKTRLITRNGLLYNKAAESYIDVKYLCDNEGLSGSLRSFQCDVLLMQGKDLQAYPELIFSAQDSGLMVFTACKHPSEDKYLISSANSKIGILSGSQYRFLQTKYHQKHGGIRRLSPGMEEYERILSFVRMYESKYEKYLVRSIYCDDKYAMVVLSPESNAADVRQYILARDSSFWEVVMDNLENEARLVVAVNKKLPDFNVEMLPRYTISEYKMKTNFSDVNQIMIDNFYISDIHQIIYTAGTTEYCYVVINDGSRYLFMTENGGWVVQRVKSRDEAYNKMVAKNASAPTFILPDDI